MYIYICMSTYTFKYTYTYTYTCINTYAHTQAHTKTKDLEAKIKSETAFHDTYTYTLAQPHTHVHTRSPTYTNTQARTKIKNLEATNKSEHASRDLLLQSSVSRMHSVEKNHQEAQEQTARLERLVLVYRREKNEVRGACSCVGIYV